MVNNCAGGVTPWGTWLSCEENFNGYFWGALAGQAIRRPQNYKRYGSARRPMPGASSTTVSTSRRSRTKPNRFGWVVEIDPFDPTFVPKKRTALGRIKHEGAAGITNKRRPLRRSISATTSASTTSTNSSPPARSITPNRAANFGLLDSGTLYVAKYNADGKGTWLPLVHGQGPLTAANGFSSQADVLIETRRAADLLGATKMDRPEDIEANPQTEPRLRHADQQHAPQGGRRSMRPTRAPRTPSATSSR